MKIFPSSICIIAIIMSTIIEIISLINIKIISMIEIIDQRGKAG